MVITSGEINIRMHSEQITNNNTPSPFVGFTRRAFPPERLAGRLVDPYYLIGVWFRYYFSILPIISINYNFFSK
jgi:hypothetical protein